MNVHLSAQFYQLRMKDNKIMLTISYLIDKIADWIQLYINKKFHSKEKKNEMFNNYEKFVKKIIAVFESVNSKRKAECKLEHLKQKKRKENSWKNQQEWNKDKKKNCEQSMNWEYINNQKTNIFKNDCWKKKLCFHYEKKKHVKKNDVKTWNINNIICNKI